MERKIGFCSRLGALEGLRPPGIPIDRIVGVLQQVGAGFVGELIGHKDSGLKRKVQP